MSFQRDVLAALRAGTEPMTNRDIRDALGMEGIPRASARVSTALNELLEAEVIQRINTEPGWARYAPIPGREAPTKRAEATAAPSSPEPRARAQRAQAPAPQPAPAAAEPACATACPLATMLAAAGQGTARPGDVKIPRETLRLLIAGVLMFGGNDLGDSLREAVIDATRRAA